MSVESTRKVLEEYFSAEHASVSTMADDVVFTVMATGEEHRGPEAVLGMLKYFYTIAFEATAEAKNIIIGDGNGVWEGTFVGRHIGEFAGIPPTNKEVRVPLCVVYDVERDKIKRARVYFVMPVLMQQLGVQMGG